MTKPAEVPITRTKVGGRDIVKYHVATALKIIEAVADGETVEAAVKGNSEVSRVTFYRWLTMYPEVKKAYDAARELSGTSLEEKALAIADKLAKPNQFTPQQVSAFRAAMEQLRWSAERRDPGNYAPRGNQATVMVPIQINTTLDLGGQVQGGLTGEGFSNVFKYEVSGPGADQASGSEASPEVPTSGPDPLELPAEVKHNMTQKPRGRPKKGHTKSPAAIKAQITRLKAKGLYSDPEQET